MPPFRTTRYSLLATRYFALACLLLATRYSLLTTASAQPANVQADPTTGALFRPAAATFISGNGLLTTSAAAAAYQPLDADLTSWAAVIRASGFDTFVAAPSSANLLALLTTKTGTGNAVFATSPTFVTPILGAATATSITAASGTLLLAGTAAATDAVRVSNTTVATASNAGAFRVGDDTAATTVAIGGGAINAGGTIDAGSYITLPNNIFYRAKLVNGTAQIVFAISNDDSTRVISAATKPIILRPADTTGFAATFSGTDGSLALASTAANTGTTAAGSFRTAGGGAIGGSFTIGGTLYLITEATPASAGAAGVKGQVAWDASFLYICVATNTWKRVAIATW